MSTAFHQVVVFGLLVAFGVGGRLLEPLWCFTPMAAVAMFAGFYFTHLRTAFCVPLCVLLISNLFLPAYASLAVYAAVYAVFAVPVLLGRRLRGHDSFAWPLAFGLIPAIAFYLVTNFAVWFCEPWYPPTWAGLAQCYMAAVPFFRWMLAGDIFYVAVLFGSYALATQYQSQPVLSRSPPARVPVSAPSSLKRGASI